MYRSPFGLCVKIDVIYVQNNHLLASSVVKLVIIANPDNCIMNRCESFNAEIFFSCGNVCYVLIFISFPDLLPLRTNKYLYE